MPEFDFWELLITIPAVLLALTFHEAAHGFVAYKLGDTTARDCGRLTLNPFRHIDPLGLLCMVLLRFGWAKPVPVDPRRFRHPRRDMALVAVAGPLINVLLSLCGRPLLLSFWRCIFRRPRLQTRWGLFSS